MIAVAVGLVEMAEVAQGAGAQTGFLFEFTTSELSWVGVGLILPGALGKLPVTPADRIAKLLDEVKAVALAGDDQREVGFLDDAEDALRAVGALDLVLANAHPAVLVDGTRRYLLDLHDR